MAIVTGGSRGIGRAIALGLAGCGARVVLASRKLPDLEAVAAEIRQQGGEGVAIAAHMRNREDIQNLVNQTLERYGRIDILVNNAATNPVFAPLLELEERAWDQVMEVNLKGYFLMSQAAGRAMVKQGGGSIINVASRSGFSPDPGLGAYCVSKAGVIMLTKALARELGQYNIRVNAIAPGLTQTRLSQLFWSDPEHRRRTEEKTPLGRIGQPEDMVGAALFLASEASRFVTGQTILVDGGFTL